MSEVTNSNLLSTPDAVLMELQRQTKYLIRVGMAKPPCPGCGRPTPLYEAHALPLDDFDFTGETKYQDGECVDCGCPLEQVVPFQGPWFWKQPVAWLRERVMPKAAAT